MKRQQQHKPWKPDTVQISAQEINPYTNKNIDSGLIFRDIFIVDLEIACIEADMAIAVIINPKGFKRLNFKD